MKKAKQYQNKLLSHIKEFGIDGLLPQNLSEDLLTILSSEYQAILDGNKSSSSTISKAVIFLINHHMISIDNIETFTISVEDIMVEIDYYGIRILFEEIRRTGIIEIPTDSFPTIENILEENSNLSFTGNMETIDNFMSRFK